MRRQPFTTSSSLSTRISPLTSVLLASLFLLGTICHAFPVHRWDQVGSSHHHRRGSSSPSPSEGSQRGLVPLRVGSPLDKDDALTIALENMKNQSQKGGSGSNSQLNLFNRLRRNKESEAQQQQQQLPPEEEEEEEERSGDEPFHPPFPEMSNRGLYEIKTEEQYK